MGGWGLVCGGWGGEWGGRCFAFLVSIKIVVGSVYIHVECSLTLTQLSGDWFV